MLHYRNVFFFFFFFSLFFFSLFFKKKRRGRMKPLSWNSDRHAPVLLPYLLTPPTIYGTSLCYTIPINLNWVQLRRPEIRGWKEEKEEKKVPSPHTPYHILTHRGFNEGLTGVGVYTTLGVILSHHKLPTVRVSMSSVDGKAPMSSSGSVTSKQHNRTGSSGSSSSSSSSMLTVVSSPALLSRNAAHRLSVS